MSSPDRLYHPQRRRYDRQSREDGKRCEHLRGEIPGCTQRSSYLRLSRYGGVRSQSPQGSEVEIDIVLSVGKFLEGNYQECFDEISELKAVCGDKHLKVILETGMLKTAENIWKASILSMAAGCDFIKTSTGKIAVNATPEATFIMCNAIKAWKEKAGIKMGYKPAGGVSTTDEAVQHFTLVKEILGEEWLNNEWFRFGASRLANNLLSSIVGKETKHF